MSRCPPEGDDLVDAVGQGQGDEQSNVAIVLRMLNHRINATEGRDDFTWGDPF
jgi:hypothetical protein